MADLATIVATSLKKHGTELNDGVFNAHPGWWWLKDRGRFKAYDGGIGITEDIIIDSISTVAARDPKRRIPVEEQDPIRMVQWRDAAVTGALPIYYADERKNATRIVDYANSLVQLFKDTFTDVVGKQFFEDGLADDGVTPTLQGLPKAIDDSSCGASDPGRYYGTIVGDETFTLIDRKSGDYPWWESYVGRTAEDLSIHAGTDKGLRNLADRCKKGKNHEQPDLLLTTLDLWQAYNALLLQSQRLENPKAAEAGFRSLMFDSATVMWDENCTAGAVYSLNSKWITVWVDRPCFSSPVITPAQEMEDALGKIIKGIWQGQMICRNPRFLGKLINKTAA